MASPQIVVVGSYNADVALQVARLPAPGETCLALGRVDGPGGKGSNQAISAARCGASVAMLAAVGRDGAGEAALAVWAAEGIETRAVARLDGCGTGMAMILVDSRGENAIIVDAGANARLAPGHVEVASATIRAANLVLAQLETPPPATAAAFRLARDSGVRTVLNAAPAPESGADDLLPLVDILVVNAVEGATLSGRVDPFGIGDVLVARVGEAVVLTLGSEGALLFTRGAAPRAFDAHAVDVVDTTGAGDAFIGAMCARLAVSDDLRTAVRWGLAAGALACTARGAAASFAGADRVAALASLQVLRQ
jgi:ribokinase